MADENQTPDSEQGTEDKAAAVVIGALSSMREDEQARPLADALEKAWDSGRFDVEAAVREIESDPEGQAGEGPG